MIAVLFDTETTDLMPNSLVSLEQRPHIIEFYAMQAVLDDGGDWQKIGEMEFRCKPPVQISEKITSITGIKNEDVAGAYSWKVHAQDVAEFISAGDMVVAHNLSFDIAMVDTEMERINMPLEWPLEKLCTVEATEHLEGHRLKLSALHELLFGEPFSGAHRAKVDVEAMFRCFRELWRRREI